MWQTVGVGAKRGEDWPLVGRAAELHRLHDLVVGAASPGVMIAGPAGVGKTRLALETLLCSRPSDRVVQMMDKLVHGKNEAIREGDNRSPEEPVPPPEGLLRSRRQEQILALILTDPDTEFPLSALARRLEIPYSSVHREIERAERFGVVKTRRFESLRLARANIDSPYFARLTALLRR